MSRVAYHINTETFGFPRVSGDELEVGNLSGGEVAFSPRERG